MRNKFIYFIVSLLIVSCSDSSEKLSDQPVNNDHPLIGDWQGFDDHYEMIYLMRDFRITEDSIYEMKYPTSYTRGYRLNLKNDSISRVLDDVTINYQWSISDSVLTLITANSEVPAEFDTTTYLRSEFQDSHFMDLVNHGMNTEILERFNWKFNYQFTSQYGWKNMDTLIYKPHKILDFHEGNYKLNEGSEIIFGLDTFRVVRFQKSHFMSDTNIYLLQFEKTIEGDTALFTYETP